LLAADVSLGDDRPTDVADEVFSEVQSHIDEQFASFERLLARTCLPSIPD